MPMTSSKMPRFLQLTFLYMMDSIFMAEQLGSSDDSDDEEDAEIEEEFNDVEEEDE